MNAMRHSLHLAVLLAWGILATGCPTGGSLQAGRVGTATCLACHNGQGAPDQHAYVDSEHYEFGVGCEDCHGPGRLHVANAGRLGLFIENPDEGGFANSYASCTPCHTETVQQFLQSDHAKEQALTCYTCHDMHRGNAWVLPYEDNRLCQQCHAFTDFPNDEAITAHTHHENQPSERASLCIGCHMQPLSRDEEQEDGHFNHSLIPAQPKKTNAAIAAGITPAPANTCAGVVGCHDGSNEEAPFFDVDNPAVNDRLQRNYDDWYGEGSEGEGEEEGEVETVAVSSAAHAAAVQRFIAGARS